MQKKSINFKDTVERYGFKPWGLRWLVRKKAIPHVKIRRRLYFVIEKVDAWIEKHSIAETDN